MKNRYELVERAVTFVVGVSVGLLLSLMSGNTWTIGLFMVGLGLVLGYYARQTTAKPE